MACASRPIWLTLVTTPLPPGGGDRSEFRDAAVTVSGSRRVGT